MVILDVGEDASKVFIIKAGVERGRRLDEIVGSSSLRCTTSRKGDQSRPGIVPLDLEVGPLVGGLVDAAELTQDRDPDLGLQGDLVPHLDELET